jgi:hypothetical protein
MNFLRSLFSKSPDNKNVKSERLIFYLPFKSSEMALLERLWERVEQQTNREIPGGIIRITSAQFAEKEQVACLQMDARADKADQVREAVVRLWHQFGGDFVTH